MNKIIIIGLCIEIIIIGLCIALLLLSGCSPNITYINLTTNNTSLISFKVDVTPYILVFDCSKNYSHIVHIVRIRRDTFDEDINYSEFCRRLE